MAPSPPVMLLFRPYKKTNLTFPGLLPGVIPLTPSLAPFTVTGRTDKRYKEALRTEMKRLERLNETNGLRDDDQAQR